MRSFVPTMGALHAGHAELIRRARQDSDEVIVSIFVNPLQFENSDDLAKYPRTPDRDREIAIEAGATEVWFPTYEEIYPKGFTRLTAGALGNLYEGASRPGHFDGVLTVVRRLFDLVKPDRAYFGEKDFQQLALVKTVAGSVTIIPVPVVREDDGLALSSRNIRLSPQGRKAAPVIFQALESAKNERSVSAMNRVMNQILASEELFTCDYALVIDSNTFEPASEDAENKRGIVAGWIDGVRLIDNMAMRSETS